MSQTNDYYKLLDRTGKRFKIGQQVEYLSDLDVDDVGTVVETPSHRIHDPYVVWIKWVNEDNRVLSITGIKQHDRAKIVYSADLDEEFTEDDAEMLQKLVEKKQQHFAKKEQSFNELVAYVKNHLHCADFKKSLEEEPEKLAGLLANYIKYKAKK